MSEQKRQDIHNSNVPVVCQSCEARHRGVCGALSTSQLSQLSKHATIQQVPAGQAFESGEDTEERCANVLKGVVKITKLMADGRQQIVGLQFAPDFLTRSSSLRSYTEAQTATDVTICSFPRRVLDEMIRDVPELGNRLRNQALRELDEARDWMLTLGRKTAAEKVASFIYLLARNLDPEAEADGITRQFVLPLARGDIADFLGLTSETVSRQMTKLRNSGIISVENSRSISILDVDALAEASGGS
ncbi:MAG: Crp/Fnr family transcriptional regulator [Hyphomicrobiaceae bacterium]